MRCSLRFTFHHVFRLLTCQWAFRSWLDLRYSSCLLLLLVVVVLSASFWLLLDLSDLSLKCDQKSPITWCRYHAAYYLVSYVFGRGCQEIFQLRTGEPSDHWVLLVDQILVRALKVIILAMQLSGIALSDRVLSFLLQSVLDQPSPPVQHLIHSWLHLCPQLSPVAGNSSSGASSTTLLPHMMSHEMLNLQVHSLGQLVLFMKVIVYQSQLGDDPAHVLYQDIVTSYHYLAILDNRWGSSLLPIHLLILNALWDLVISHLVRVARG